jgi:autotransporter translocation and assembly factor TamB
MKRFLRYFLYLALLLLILSSAFMYVILYTETGLHMVIHFAKHHFGRNITIGQSTGNLAREFTLHNLYFKQDNAEVRAKQAIIRFQPRQLFSHRLVINKLHANDIAINLPETKSTRQSNWLQDIQLDNINLNNLTLLKNNKTISLINQVNIKKSYDNYSYFIINLKQGEITGRFKLDNLIKPNWELNAEAKNIDTNDLWQNTHALSFQLNSKGFWRQDDKRFNFLLTHLQGRIQRSPITGTIDVQVDNNKIAINNIDLTLANTFIKAQGHIGDDWNLVWNINAPNLHLIHTHLFGQLTSKGTILTNQKVPRISGTIFARGIRFNQLSIGTIDGTLQSLLQQQNRASLNVTLNQIKLTNYQIPNIKLNANIDWLYPTIRSQINIIFSAANQINADITIHDLTNTKRLSGQIVPRLNNLNQLISLPRAQLMNGNLVGNITLSGTLNQPRFQGSIDFRNGEITLPELGIRISQIQLQNTFTQALLLTLNGNFRSGNGTGNIRGTVNLNRDDFPLQIKITGNNLNLVNLKEYKIRATPDLDIAIAHGNATLSGNLLLPYVSIITDSYSQVITLPRELTFAGEKKPTRYLEQFAIRMHLQLGQNNLVDYKELRAKLGGEISIYQVPGGLPTANGELQIIQGVYKIYNRVFNIDHGRLIYVGNLVANPGLNIEAIQQLNLQTRNFLGFRMNSQENTMRVGVSVRGTLEHPVVTLLSIPPMNQDDILSYMVFGQPRSQISSLDALSVLGMLSTNLDMQGSGLGNQPNQSGEFLNIFKMGIFNPTQAFNFSLPISESFQVQTEANPSETGADITYSKETD